MENTDLSSSKAHSDIVLNLSTSSGLLDQIGEQITLGSDLDSNVNLLLNDSLSDGAWVTATDTSLDNGMVFRGIVDVEETEISEISSTPPEENALEFWSCQWQLCETIVPSMDALVEHIGEAHLRLDSGETEYVCKWKNCPREYKGFDKRYKIVTHVRTHTLEKPHRCALCGKSFARVDNYKRHMRFHTGEKPYVCPYEGCNRAFRNSADRHKHSKKHEDARPFPCPWPGCDKAYSDPSSLRKHARNVGHGMQHIPQQLRMQLAHMKKSQVPKQPRTMSKTRQRATSSGGSKSSSTKPIPIRPAYQKRPSVPLLVDQEPSKRGGKRTKRRDEVESCSQQPLSVILPLEHSGGQDVYSIPMEVLDALGASHSGSHQQHTQQPVLLVQTTNSIQYENSVVTDSRESESPIDLSDKPIDLKVRRKRYQERPLDLTTSPMKNVIPRRSLVITMKK